MKAFVHHVFDAENYCNELATFTHWLASNATLDEVKDILPFFRRHPNITVSISQYISKMMNADLLAYEFPVFGDFVADLVVGDVKSHNYLLVEFENANPHSLFKARKGKSKPEWAPRFEHAFSQILDWMWKLEDMRSTSEFEHIFGSRHAKFHGLIITGKDMVLSQQEHARLRWRMDKVLVDSNTVSCVSLDKLRDDLGYWLGRGKTG